MSQKALNAEIIEFFNLVDVPPCSGLANISFLTFLLANCSEDFIEIEFPNLYKHYKFALGEEEDKHGLV